MREGAAGPRSVADLRQILACALSAELPDLISAWSGDTRAGVRALVHRAENRLQAEDKRMQAFLSRTSMERKLASHGFVCIAGADEAGRGALAGPLVAAAVVLGEDLTPFHDVNDSKQLTPQERRRLYELIVSAAAGWSVHRVEAEDIDAMGIAVANRVALERAVAALGSSVDYVISDAFKLGTEAPSLALLKGDAVSVSVAAASIVAKQTRDTIMEELANAFPGYGFERNKGYGTDDHVEALGRLGVSSLHRRSFSPCAQPQPTAL